MSYSYDDDNRPIVRNTKLRERAAALANLSLSLMETLLRADHVCVARVERQRVVTCAGVVRIREHRDNPCFR